MAGPGGARPGAGRKRKSEKFSGQIAKAEKRIADRLVDYIDNLQALAAGVWVKEEDRDGRERIYLRAPDRQANEYLINRIMGKPIERKEVSGPDGAAIPLEVQRIDYRDGLTDAAQGSVSDIDAPGEN